MASFSVKIIRAAFGMAEHLSPALAGRLAFEMFCRTRNPETLTDRERRVVEQAARFMAEARRHRLTTRSGTVMAFEFKPLPGTPTVATVLVVHGCRDLFEAGQRHRSHAIGRVGRMQLA